MVRSDSRPMRPNPLIPTRVGMGEDYRLRIVDCGLWITARVSVRARPQFGACQDRQSTIHNRQSLRLPQNPKPNEPAQGDAGGAADPGRVVAECSAEPERHAYRLELLVKRGSD